MAFLGGLDLKLDPWHVDYGVEVSLGPAPALPDEKVDPAVEVPLAVWQPIHPVPGARLAPRLLFIDGVRRVEARVMGRDGENLVHGAFGTFAVGCVAIEDGRARWAGERVERVLSFSSGFSLGDPVAVTTSGFSYRPISTSDSDPDAPLRRLQTEMRTAESALARDCALDAATLVIADGPLRFDDAQGAAVGYVKRFFQRHGAPLDALAALEPGTRTPLLALSGGGFARYTWFVRLAERGPAELDLAGLVRLEVSDAVGLETARALADGSAARLPAFAPSRSRDPRAPQNLLPIGALESRLRRLMGDPLLARRRIETLLARPEPLYA
jgi:hypothetical protein